MFRLEALGFGAWGLRGIWLWVEALVFQVQEKSSVKGLEFRVLG